MLDQHFQASDATPLNSNDCGRRNGKNEVPIGAGKSMPLWNNLARERPRRTLGPNGEEMHACVTSIVNTKESVECPSALLFMGSGGGKSDQNKPHNMFRKATARCSYDQVPVSVFIPPHQARQKMPRPFGVDIVPIPHAMYA
jgi:hypothetical protein